VIAVLAIPGPPSLRDHFAGKAVAVPDLAWDDLFQDYGDSSGTWSGGDGAQSLLMPDGSTTWFFGDTYLGATDPDGTRPPLNTGVAHNSAVLYRDGMLGPAYAAAPGSGGYSYTGDYTWVIPPPAYPASRYELVNGDQVIDHGTVYKFYQLADRDLHPAGFGYKLVGTVIEAFAIDSATDTLTPVGGTPVGIEDSAASNPVIWGAATLVAGGYIYIYGVRPYNGSSGTGPPGDAPGAGAASSTASPFPLYLARVPVGGLAAGDAWQYYDGVPGCSPSAGAWASNPRSATALRSGVSAGFSVTDVNGTYVLLTSDTSSAPSVSDAVAFYARCPTGFSASSPEYSIYRPAVSYGYLVYEYRIVPQFSAGRDVLISYSTNTLRVDGSCLNENFYNATIYRPRFLTVRLPGIGGRAGPIAAPASHPPPAFTAPPVPQAQEKFHPQSAGDHYVARNCQPGTAPANPPQLSLSGNSAGAITVTWSMRPAAMWMYTVGYCDTSTSDCGTNLATVSSTDPACTPRAVPDATCGSVLDWASTSMSLHGLRPGDTYEIQVSAANAVDRSASAWSDVLTVQAAPSALP
jgi:Fibronectin type III domain